MITKRNEAIAEVFRRILQTGPDNDAYGINPEPVQPNTMITKVTVQPDPFLSVLTLDVVCTESRYIIVRMFNDKDKIVKMFSWYLVKGTNVTSVNDVGSLKTGEYILDIIDNEGSVLFTCKAIKG